jgi:hypothetical protein
VQTRNLRVNAAVWDTNVCHTYWYVYSGQGNVAQNMTSLKTSGRERRLPPVFMTTERIFAGLQQTVSYLHGNGVTAFNEPGIMWDIEPRHRWLAPAREGPGCPDG